MSEEFERYRPSPIESEEDPEKVREHFREELEAAVTRCTARIAADPLSARCRINLGKALDLAGHREEAANAYTEAVGLIRAPEQTSDIYWDALLRLGNLDTVDGLCREALRVNSRDANAHYFLGLCQVRKRENDAAERSFEAALRIRPPFHDDSGNAAEPHGDGIALKGEYQWEIRGELARLRVAKEDVSVPGWLAANGMPRADARGRWCVLYRHVIRTGDTSRLPELDALARQFMSDEGWAVGLAEIAASLNARKLAQSHSVSENSEPHESVGPGD